MPARVRCAAGVQKGCRRVRRVTAPEEPTRTKRVEPSLHERHRTYLRIRAIPSQLDARIRWITGASGPAPQTRRRTTERIRAARIPSHARRSSCAAASGRCGRGPEKSKRTRAARIPWTLAYGGSSAPAVPPASAAPNHPNEPERRGFFQVRIRSFCDGGSGRGGGGPEKSKPTRAARISRIWMPAYGRPFCAGGSLAAPGAGNSERTRATDSTGSSMSYGSRQQAPAGWSPSVEAAASRSLATGGRLRAQLGEAS